MRASNEAQKSRVRNWYCHDVKVRWDKCQKRKTIQFTKKTTEIEKMITSYYVTYQTRAGWNSCRIQDSMS